MLPWRSLIQNVALPLELQGVGKAERFTAAERALGQVGLLDAIRRYPAQLSGGMKMCASLARRSSRSRIFCSWMNRSRRIDEITRQKLDEQLRQLWAAHGMTVLFVTHSTTEAAFLANRAVVFSARPARVVADTEIDLPAERNGPLRATPEFARATQAIYEALEKGGA